MGRKNYEAHELFILSFLNPETLGSHSLAAQKHFHSPLVSDLLSLEVTTGHELFIREISYDFILILSLCFEYPSCLCPFDLYFIPYLLICSVKMSVGEVACSYAALILHEDGIEVTVSLLSVPLGFISFNCYMI